MLWAEAVEKGYAAPIWMTFKQALELGGHVRKGEKGSLVVYASGFTRTEPNDATGEELERDIPFMKGYTVFNVEQVEGLPANFYAVVQPVLDPVQRIARVDEFFARTPADIRHGGNRAFYRISTDHIQMPPFESFRDADSHAATVAHELCHWTRHESRLNRDFGQKRFGDEANGVEELMAELGAAFICADLELKPELREDHASYLDHWLTVMKQDKRAIFTAASHAQRAADFLHGLQVRPQFRKPPSGLHYWQRMTKRPHRPPSTNSKACQRHSLRRDGLDCKQQLAPRRLAHNGKASCSGMM
jgi:antirestriction protein ArdC